MGLTLCTQASDFRTLIAYPVSLLPLLVQQRLVLLHLLGPTPQAFNRRPAGKEGRSAYVLLLDFVFLKATVPGMWS